MLCTGLLALALLCGLVHSKCPPFLNANAICPMLCSFLNLIKKKWSLFLVKGEILVDLLSVGGDSSRFLGSGFFTLPPNKGYRKILADLGVSK